MEKLLRLYNKVVLSIKKNRSWYQQWTWSKLYG